MTTGTPSSGPVVISPAPAQYYISPVGFFTRAEEFLEASGFLSEKKGRTSFVAAHLACSAIEMALKAFLLTRGYTVESVRKFRHDLHSALLESFTLGIEDLVTLAKPERDLLLRINDDYEDRRFAYFDIDSAIVRPRDPDLDLLPKVARKLVDGLKQRCLDATGG